MAAKKGNKNAARDGAEKLFRVRVNDKNDLPLISMMNTYERGLALTGYIIWQDSPESEEIGFIDWIKSKIEHADGFEWNG